MTDTFDARRRAILEAAEARVREKTARERGSQANEAPTARRNLTRPPLVVNPPDLPEAPAVPITIPDPIALGFKIGIGIFLANLLLGGILTLIVYACWTGR